MPCVIIVRQPNRASRQKGKHVHDTFRSSSVSRTSWPPARLGLPRVLAQAASLSLACLAMTLCSAPAHAGHWVLTPTASGQSTLNGSTWRTFYMSSAPTTNSVSTGYALAASGISGPATATQTPTVTATSDLTLTVKAVWTADSNSDNTPPPSGIWFSEDTTATGTFSDNNGPTQVGQTVNDGFNDLALPSGSNIGTAAKVHYVQTSGGTVTTTLTASVSAKGTAGASGSATASIGPITISIHAQPYNYHQTGVTINDNGTLTFKYAWLSTDGNLSDLDPFCLVHEYVSYQGGSHYTLPAPFTVTAPSGGPATLQNPTISPTPKLPGSTGVLTDNQLFGGTSPLNAAPPYYEQTFTGTQTYEFGDSATGQVNQPIPGPDAGPLSITRNIGVRSQYLPNWWYSVTKNGTTAWAPLGN